MGLHSTNFKAPGSSVLTIIWLANCSPNSHPNEIREQTQFKIQRLNRYSLLSSFISVNKKWRQIKDHIAIPFPVCPFPAACRLCLPLQFQFSSFQGVSQIASILKSCYVDRRTGQVWWAWWALGGLLDERAMYEFRLRLASNPICRLQQLQHQQICANTWRRQLNTASAIWRRNHHHLAVYRTSKYFSGEKLFSSADFSCEYCVNTDRNYWHQPKRYLEVELASAGSF